MRSHAGVAAQAFRALAERAVNIRAITTSEIKFSLLIDAAFTELAVRTLHSLYGLDNQRIRRSIAARPACAAAAHKGNLLRRHIASSLACGLHAAFAIGLRVLAAGPGPGRTPLR